jgi:hypothetical protein
MGHRGGGSQTEHCWLRCRETKPLATAPSRGIWFGERRGRGRELEPQQRRCADRRLTIPGRRAAEYRHEAAGPRPVLEPGRGLGGLRPARRPRAPAGSGGLCGAHLGPDGTGRPHGGPFGTGGAGTARAGPARGPQPGERTTADSGAGARAFGLGWPPVSCASARGARGTSRRAAASFPPPSPEAMALATGTPTSRPRPRMRYSSARPSS